MVSRDTRTDAQKLGDALSEFVTDPLGYVMFAFPWTDPNHEEIQIVELKSPYKERFPNCKYGPDVWACEFLDELGQQILARRFDGRNAVEPIQIATASGHGIGKSVLVAWLIKFIMDTRPGSMGTVTANTAEQLKIKTWAQVGKWHKISITADWFKYNSGRGAMNLVHKEEPQSWRCDAQTCREENSEAFAGQHSANATSFYIFDEASAVPDKIFEVREGGLTDGEPMVFDFGNPTRNSGRFYEQCAGRLRHRYITRCIDSRDVELPNKEHIQRWLEDYGVDSDFFKVRVRGMFPSAGTLQFIPRDLVEGAMAREDYADPHAQLIIGVDVARHGDNESVIYPRIGYDARTHPASRFRGLDTVQLTGRVVETIRAFKAMGIECAGLFVDDGGIGGAIVDNLLSLGYNPIPVQFGGKAMDRAYRFKGDEIWGKLRDALPKLLLPAKNQVNGLDLLNGLTQREFGYTLLGNKIHLETKKDMAARGIDSPDIVDALAVTFAEDIAPGLGVQGLSPGPRMCIHEYDPLTMD